MEEQKDEQSALLHHRTGSKQESASNIEDAHWQSVGIKSAGDGSHTTNNLATQSQEEVAKAAILMFEHIEEQIGRADTKAQLTLAADALLVGTLASLGKGTASSLLSNTSPVLDRLADLFTILMFLALICSVYWAIRVVNPHLRGSKRFTLMYFGQISQMNEDDFIQKFLNQSLHDLKVSTLAQVHTTARIAQLKFTRARWSVNFLLMSLVFWTIIQLLLAFS